MGARLNQENRLSIDSFHCYSPKIKLIWTHVYTRSYGRLSFNVVREVASYLRDAQKPLLILKKEVQFFDIRASAWQQLYTLREKLPICSEPYSCVLEEDTLFVCGQTKSPYPDVFLLHGNGSVRSLPDMETRRRAPAILYRPDTSSIICFGGYGRKVIRRLFNLELITTVLRSCEKLKIGKAKWEKMSEMCEARYNFNPCVYSSVVYLCGGGVKSVETYDPRSDVFTLVPMFVLPESSSCVSVVQSGCLVVVSNNYITKWKPRQKGVNIPHPMYKAVSACSPIVYEGCIYIVPVKSRSCRCISLETGDIEMEAQVK